MSTLFDDSGSRWDQCVLDEDADAANIESVGRWDTRWEESSDEENYQFIILCLVSSLSMVTINPGIINLPWH